MLFACLASAAVVVKGRDMKQLNLVSARPAWVSWPCVKLCSVLDQVYSSAWFNKVDSPPQMNVAVEHLALPWSQRAQCSHDTVPLWSTC